jgi:hypothetical protein
MSQSDDTVKSLGSFSTSKALFMLYETAAPHLSDDELKFLENATESAQLQAENMREIVDGMAALINNDNGKSWSHEHQTPTLLWQMSYQFDLIAGLIELGTSAEYRRNNPERFISEHDL